MTTEWTERDQALMAQALEAAEAAAAAGEAPIGAVIARPAKRAHWRRRGTPQSASKTLRRMQKFA